MLRREAGIPLFADAAAFSTDARWSDDTIYGDHWRMAIGGGPSDPVRLVLISLANGPIVISIDSWDPAGQAAFVEKAMPIVESFTFPQP